MPKLNKLRISGDTNVANTFVKWNNKTLAGVTKLVFVLDADKGPRVELHLLTGLKGVDPPPFMPGEQLPAILEIGIDNLLIKDFSVDVKKLGSKR